MTNRKELGKLAEDIVAELLINNGFIILERNWRFSRAEIDIIAKEEATKLLVFVEVKSKTYVSFGEPESSVNIKKQRLITDAAAAYMEFIGYDWEIRFDIVSIVFENAELYSITHFKDAFLI